MTRINFRNNMYMNWNYLNLWHFLLRIIAIYCRSQQSCSGHNFAFKILKHIFDREVVNYIDIATLNPKNNKLSQKKKLWQVRDFDANIGFTYLVKRQPFYLLIELLLAKHSVVVNKTVRYQLIALTVKLFSYFFSYVHVLKICLVTSTFLLLQYFTLETLKNLSAHQWC